MITMEVRVICGSKHLCFKKNFSFIDNEYVADLAYLWHIVFHSINKASFPSERTAIYLYPFGSVKKACVKVVSADNAYHRVHVVTYSYALVTVTPMSSRAPGTTTEPKIITLKRWLTIEPSKGTHAHVQCICCTPSDTHVHVYTLSVLKL